MPHYLIQGSYTPEAWAAMVREPQDRAAIIRPVVEGLGGKMHALFFAFGESDAILLAEVPDSVSAAALAIAFAAVSIEVANCPVEDSVGGLVDDALDTRIDIARELRRGAGTRERECHRHEYRSKAQV